MKYSRALRGSYGLSSPQVTSQAAEHGPRPDFHAVRKVGSSASTALFGCASILYSISALCAVRRASNSRVRWRFVSPESPLVVTE